MGQYKAGYISVANGSTSVTGHGTRWLNYVSAGDEIYIGNNPYLISTVDDNNAITLTTASAEATQVQQFYYINTFVNLERLRAAKTIELKAAAHAAIVAGINNSALGSSYFYPTAETDQQNIQTLMIEASLAGSGDSYLIWCKSTGNVWDRRDHTKAQLTTIFSAINTHIKAQQSHHASLLITLAAASNESAIAAVVW